MVDVDRVAVGQPVDALGAGEVEENGAADQRLAQGHRVAVRRAEGGDLGGGPVAVHLAFVEDVGERVPVGRRLQRQDDGVVGVADPAGDRFAEQALGAGGVFGAGQGRVADAVVAAEVAGLGTAGVEGHAEADDLSGAHVARRVADDPAGDQVGGAALVGGAPASPVGELGDVLVENVALDLRAAAAHAGSGIEVLAAPFRPRISRASSGVAGSSESSPRIRTVRSTCAAFDSASTPRRR